MANLDKVRVQLLDESTGAVLKEVNVLTSADAVTFADGQTFQQKLDGGLLKGPQGVQGIQGVQGPAGDPFTIAKVYSSVSAMNTGFATDGLKIGSFVLIDTGNINDADNAKLYVKGSTAYTYITDLSGATGMQGPQGIQGIQGPQGAAGIRGSQWYSGTAITGTSTSATVFTGSGITSALVNDQYFNTSTGNVYVCTVSGNASTAKWIYSICLKGATGATGAAGPTGATGPQGPAGADGASIKVGTDYASGTQVKLFLKTM